MLSHDSQSHIRWDWPFYQTLLPLSCLFLPADHSAALPFFANVRHPCPQNSLPFSAAINAQSKFNFRSFFSFLVAKSPKGKTGGDFSAHALDRSQPLFYFIFRISHSQAGSTARAPPQLWLRRVPGTILTRRAALQALLIKWQTSTNDHTTNTTTYNLAFHFTTSFGLFRCDRLFRSLSRRI